MVVHRVSVGPGAGEDGAVKRAWTVTSGAWLPLKKAVSISKPKIRPEFTPSYL